MTEITMPRLSESMTTGRLLRWLVQPGDTVRVGDVVAEVETDKANMEIECLSTGTISEILARPGEDLPVGAVLAQITPGAVPEKPHSPLPTQESEPSVDATPLAIKRARELGLDLGTVRGTGPQGRILTEDVEDAAAHRSAASASTATMPELSPNQPQSVNRFPGGFAMRSRVSAFQIVQSLAHLEKACGKPAPTWSREQTAAIVLVLAAIQAMGSTAARQGQLERPVQDLALTLITPAGIAFYEIPFSEARSLASLASALHRGDRQAPRKAGALEATVAIACGLDSLEPMNPGDIHLSVSIPQALGEANSEVAISLITEGDSRLPFGVQFLRDYSALLRQPLLLLGVGQG